MKLAVIGVGLIGGSFALALKQAKQVAHVVGVGRNPANLKAALERGIIDSALPDATAAARGADLVLVATPVGQYPAVFASLRETRALITDAGSTKRDASHSPTSMTTRTEASASGFDVGASGSTQACARVFASPG